MAECFYGCDGSGAVRVHSEDCEGLAAGCALAGDMGDCRGDVVDCPCTATRIKSASNEAGQASAVRVFRDVPGTTADAKHEEGTC